MSLLSVHGRSRTESVDFRFEKFPCRVENLEGNKFAPIARPSFAGGLERVGQEELSAIGCAADVLSVIVVMVDRDWIWRTEFHDLTLRYLTGNASQYSPSQGRQLWLVEPPLRLSRILSH